MASGRWHARNCALDRPELRVISAAEPLAAAAELALLLTRERPDLLVVAGSGPLQAPGIAAAGVCATKLAHFGAGRGEDDVALDLGDDPPEAVERLTGVAREIN